VGGEDLSSFTTVASVPTSSPRLEVEIYAQSVHLFLPAISQGMSASAALEEVSTLVRGSFSHYDKCFFPQNASLGPIAGSIGHLFASRRLVVSGCEGGRARAGGAVRRSEPFTIPIASCLQGTILAPTQARPPRPAAWLTTIRHFG
jgi:hypothetical protein